MSAEVLTSFSSLQNELELAKSSLKGVDENIKRLIGRDPSEHPPRPTLKRANLVQNDERLRVRAPIVQEDRSRTRVSARSRLGGFENDEPVAKKRPVGTSVFKRLSERPVHDEEIYQPTKHMISKVIVTQKEIPSRQEALEAQNKDERSKARNRRMFGALLGTLQRFQQEETKLKKKEEKRAELEKKIEEHEIKEKEEIKKERQELFLSRRKKQAEIKMIELKMLRMKEYSKWEERQKPRTNFILTKAKPHIYYLPRRLNDKTKALLESSKAEIEKAIQKKKEKIQTELFHIEERMRRSFEPKKLKNENDMEMDHQYDDDVIMREVYLDDVKIEKMENGSSHPHADARHEALVTNGDANELNSRELNDIVFPKQEQTTEFPLINTIYNLSDIVLPEEPQVKV